MPGRVWLGWTRQSKAGIGKARQGEAGIGRARLGRLSKVQRCRK